MENLKQKFLYLLLWIASKLHAIASHFARHFVVWLVALTIPPLVMTALLFLQHNQVQQVLEKPTLSTRQVRKLEQKLEVSQKATAHYKAKSDSLETAGNSKATLAAVYQASADSLKILYDQVPASSLSAAELSSFLTTYKPVPTPGGL